jgi:hypothetical protein
VAILVPAFADRGDRAVADNDGPTANMAQRRPPVPESKE